MGNGTAEPAGSGFRLGIDFGTWNTTAILRWPDGHARPLLFDGSPLLPSAVYVDLDGQLLVGRDAIHAARLDPARLEPNPKRRVERDGEDTTVQLGDRAVTVAAMVSAVFGRVTEEAVRVSGVDLGAVAVTLTHPAGWDAGRLALLQRAAARAGLTDPRLLPEPVAAAGYFVSVLGRSIPAGSALVVYDFGAGTFDASVVVPAGPSGYQVLAVAGLADVGGVDLDAALLRHVAQTYRSADPAAWQRLDEPATPADRRHRRHLVEDVRAAKEMLSRATSATVPVPLLELEARVSRAEFDQLARPLLERTVQTTAAVIAAAGLTPDRIAGILLVGGSSRIPLVAELLRGGTGQDPSTMDQPETVVAEGSIRLADGGTGLTRSGSPVPVAPATAVPLAVAPAAPNPTAPTVVNANATTAPVPRTPAEPGRLHAPADPWAGAEPTAPELPALPPVPATWAPRAATVPVPPPTVIAPRIPGPPPQRRASPGAPTQVGPRPGDPRYGPAGPTGHQDPYRPNRSNSGRVVRPKGSGRWSIVATAVLGLLVLAAGTAYLTRDQWTSLLPGQAGAPSTASTNGPNGPAGPSATAPATPFVRTDPPGWLPAGWTSVVDDAATPSVIPGPANKEGTCDYPSPGVLHVTRDSFDVSGCQTAQFVRSLVVSDAAVEAQFSVTAGCAGMWMRTGSAGYFLLVCSDGTVGLHRLANDPPSTATLISPTWRAADPKNMVVGLLAQGQDPVQLTVFVDGVAQKPVTDASTAGSAPLRTGHLALGGFAPHPDDRMDATITRYRAWTPAGS